MPDAPNLRPATRDELTQSLSFALRFNGRKRERGADEIMANITAERLVEHLERSGYVVMCKLGLAPHRVDLGAAIDQAIKQEGVFITEGQGRPTECTEKPGFWRFAQELD